MEFAINMIGAESLESERDTALFQMMIWVVVTGSAQMLQLIQSSLLSLKEDEK